MATTGSQPNLYQLGVEIGGNPPFRMTGPDAQGVYTVRSPEVDEPTLQAALDAHVADFGIVAPPTPAEVQQAVEQANASTIDQAITAALTRLQELVDAPAVDVPPSGTMTTAQLSNVVRAMRDAVQANRAGAQEVALTLKRTIRLVRGDFDAVD